MRVSEIRVKRIRVNQGLGVCTLVVQKLKVYYAKIPCKVIFMLLSQSPRLIELLAND